ncbi:MAG: hypothetical protein ACRC2U_20910 [Aeromonas sp.]
MSFDEPLNVRGLSKLLDIPDTTLYDWIAIDDWYPAPVDLPGRGGSGYPVVEFLLAVIKGYRQRQKERRPSLPDPTKISLTEAKTRLVCVQTEHEKTKLDILIGQLLPLDEQTAIAVRQVRAVCNALDNLPTRLAPTLATITDPLEIRDILTTELTRARAEIADGLE